MYRKSFHKQTEHIDADKMIQETEEYKELIRLRETAQENVKHYKASALYIMHDAIAREINIRIGLKRRDNSDLIKMYLSVLILLLEIEKKFI